MISLIKTLYNKLHIIHNIYIKNRFFIKKKSYSMEKEDLEITKRLNKIKNGFYVDVGGYHPVHRNNTFLLYKKNWRGINIDLSKFSIDLFKFARPEDINLNVAVSKTNKKIKYYTQKKISQLTTIHKDIANKRMQGPIIEKEILSNTLTALIDKTKYKDKRIDFLNIDAEGADFEILESLNFDVYRPKLICVEIDNKQIENSKIFNFLKKQKYTNQWSATFSYIFTDDLYNFDRV